MRKMRNLVRIPGLAAGLLLLLGAGAPAAGQWDQCNPGEERPFSAGPYDVGYYDTAADFTLNVLDGSGNTGATWTYSDIWPGCENVIFFGYRRNSCYAVYTARSEPDVLMENSPRNVHYVFVSFETDPSLVLEDVQTIRADYELALDAMDPADQDWWRPRIHYVTDSAFGLPAWFNDFLEQTFFNAHPYWGWGIDRFQRIRNIGMTQDPNFVIECVPGDPSSQTWFPRTSHLANEARYYNFEWWREQQMAADAYTTIDVWQERFAGSIYADVTFPDASEMSTYDTMLFDMELLCWDRNADTVINNLDCEWDYLIYAYICDRDDPNSCGTEMGRWITTYGRDGRWVVDVSPMLAFIRDGGQRRMRFYSQNGYDITFKVLLTNRGKGYRPHGIEYLYRGGTFGPNYNANHPPKDVLVPSWADRTELAAYISGHGFGDTFGCAEFCNHEHFFRFGLGTPYARSHTMAAEEYGCMQQITEELDGFAGPGTVPNQFGTWVFGRAGWCPGLEVKPWVENVSGDVTPGSTTTVTYQGLFEGADYDPPDPGSFRARIDMNSWLVYHIRAPETDCDDTIDNDGDTTTDCEDTACWADPACIDGDFDGDGALNRDDCEPLDGSAFARPVLDRIYVARPAGPSTDPVVSWDDLVPVCGTGTTYDFVSGSLSDLNEDGGFGRAQCSRDQTDNFYTETQAGSYYYFARAKNTCGTTSLGRSVGGICD